MADSRAEDDGWSAVGQNKKKKPRKPKEEREPEAAWFHIRDVPDHIREHRYFLQQTYRDENGNEVSGAAQTMCLVGYERYEKNGYRIRQVSPIISEREKLQEEELMTNDSGLVYLLVNNSQDDDDDGGAGPPDMPSARHRRRQRQRERRKKQGNYYIVYQRA